MMVTQEQYNVVISYSPSVAPVAEFAQDILCAARASATGVFLLLRGHPLTKNARLCEAVKDLLIAPEGTEQRYLLQREVFLRACGNDELADKLKE